MTYKELESSANWSLDFLADQCFHKPLDFIMSPMAKAAWSLHATSVKVAMNQRALLKCSENNYESFNEWRPYE